MQHIGVGNEDARLIARFPSIRSRGVAIIGSNRHLLYRVQRLQKFCQSGGLVLGKGLCGKQIQGSGLRICQCSLEHGKVVAEGLSGGSSCDHHHVLATQCCLDRRSLVCEERRRAPRLKCGDEARIKTGREIRVFSFAGRQFLPGRHVFHKGRVAPK